MSLAVDSAGVPTPALYESLLLADRPTGWWGLDTADPLADDSGHGYSLTAVGTPANAASLLSRGDGGLAGSRDFDGSSGAYYVQGSTTAVADGPPYFVEALHLSVTSEIAIGDMPACKAGDLVIAVLEHATQTATISDAPSGWTQVGSTTNATNHAVAVYKHLPSTDEPRRTLPWSWSVSGALSTIIFVYRGVDPSVSGLISASSITVTSAGFTHSTASIAHPDQARQVVIWTTDSGTPIITPERDGTERFRADGYAIGGYTAPYAVLVDYVKKASGSGLRSASTSTSVAMGATIITFGSPRKILMAELDGISSHATVHAIIRPDTITGTDTIISKYQSWAVQLNAGTVEFTYRDGGGVDRTVAGPSVSASATTHLTVVDDGTNIRFTKNGVRTTATRLGAAGYTTNANRVVLGARYDGAAYANYFDGRLDEVAVWSVALSDQMIDTYWTAYNTGLFGDFLQGDKSGRYPRAKLEIAWRSRPTDSVLVYDNASPDLRADAGLSTTGGRNFELDRYESARMDFTLDNRQRQYDRNYTSSPYYPNVKPTRACRFRAQSAVDQPVQSIFFGYTEGLPLKRLASGRDSTVVLTASDAFRAFSIDKISDTDVRETELAGVRLEHLLGELAGIPFIGEASVHRVIGDDLKGVNRLDHAQAVAETDGGLLFADGLGRGRFQDNQHRAKYERTVRATYGDGGGTELPFVHMEPETDDARLFTQASVTPSSGNVKTSKDDAAALDYFVRTKEVATIHADDNDAQAMSEAFALRYSTPRERVPEILLAPAGGTIAAAQAMWGTVLGHEVSHRISTKERPPGGAGAAVTREHFVEGIKHEINGRDWRVTFSLSPADLDGDYWILGQGRLDTGTGSETMRLGW